MVLLVAWCATTALSIPRASAEKTQGIFSHSTPLRVGVLLPLSGPYKKTGESLLNAIILSVFDNQADNIELFIEDTKGDAEEAIMGLRQLLEYGAEVVLGPIFTTEIKNLRYYACPVPILSFSNNTDFMREHFYTLGYSPAQQAIQLLNYVHKTHPGETALILSPSDFGEYITKLVVEQNWPIALYTYSKDHKAQQSIFQKIKNKKYENVWVPEGGVVGISIVGQMRFSLPDVDFQLLGSDAWEDSMIIKDPSYKGGWYAGPHSKHRQTFMQNYQKQYGTPPSRLSSIAYDALSLIIALSAQGDFDSRKLVIPGGFKGMDGFFRLMPNGSVERSFSILEMRGGGKIKVLQPSNLWHLTS